jgi:hypothetical protein
MTVAYEVKADPFYHLAGSKAKSGRFRLIGEYCYMIGLRPALAPKADIHSPGKTTHY